MDKWITVDLRCCSVQDGFSPLKFLLLTLTFSLSPGNQYLFTPLWFFLYQDDVTGVAWGVPIVNWLPSLWYAWTALLVLLSPSSFVSSVEKHRIIWTNHRSSVLLTGIWAASKVCQLWITKAAVSICVVVFMWTSLFAGDTWWHWHCMEWEKW